MANWADREEESIENDYQEGIITLAEYNEALRDLSKEVRRCAEEAGEEAYNREMDRY